MVQTTPFIEQYNSFENSRTLKYHLITIFKVQTNKVNKLFNYKDVISMAIYRLNKPNTQ